MMDEKTCSEATLHLMTASRISALPHEGGKNAADRLLLQDAHALFEQQGVRDFYLVSNDGGFAPHISILRVAGCQVTVIGNDHAAKQLKKVVPAL